MASHMDHDQKLYYTDGSAGAGGLLANIVSNMAVLRGLDLWNVAEQHNQCQQMAQCTSMQHVLALRVSMKACICATLRSIITIK